MNTDVSARRLQVLTLVSLAVGVGTFLALLAVGMLPTLAFAFGALAGLFALAVIPLVVIANEVGSKADDHEEIERRVAAGLGLSKTEFDASFEDGGRRGRSVEFDEEDPEEN